MVRLLISMRIGDNFEAALSPNGEESGLENAGFHLNNSVSGAHDHREKVFIIMRI